MKFFYLRILPALLLTIPLANHAAAQANKFITFLQAGQSDAAKLTSAYLNPAMEGFSYGVNGGWFHTARTHDRLGFDISITATGVFFPTSATSFRHDQLRFNNTVRVGCTEVSPTLIRS